MGTPSHCKNVFVKKLHIPKNDKYVSRLYWTKQNNYNKHVFLSPINSPHWRFQSRYTEMPDVVDRCQRWVLTAVRLSYILQRIPTRILSVPTSWWPMPTSASCSSQTATLLPAPLTALAPQIPRPSAHHHLFFPSTFYNILLHFTTFYYILHFTSENNLAAIHGF